MLFSGHFLTKATNRLKSHLTNYLRQRFLPFPWSHTRLRLENLIEMGMAGETTLSRNRIIVVMRVFSQHPLRLLKSDVAEPYSESTLQITFKILAE